MKPNTSTSKFRIHLLPLTLTSLLAAVLVGLNVLPRQQETGLTTGITTIRWRTKVSGWPITITEDRMRVELLENSHWVPHPTLDRIEEEFPEKYRKSPPYSLLINIAISLLLLFIFSASIEFLYRHLQKRKTMARNLA